MKKPKKCILKCTKHRCKIPWCLKCWEYTRNPYDPIYAQVPEDIVKNKDLYENLLRNEVIEKDKQLTPSDAITIIRILDSLSDSCEVYMGYDHMKKDRKELKKIIKKLNKFL